MGILLVKLKEMFFPTEFKWENSPHYCRQLPALEKIEPA